jgi:hypothetical protein
MRDCMHQNMHVEKRDKAPSLGRCLNMWRQHHPSDKYKKKSVDKVVTAFINRTADYPKHPDTVVISKKDRVTSGPEYHEKDVYDYYEGVKSKMMPELKGRNLFVRLKTDTGYIYVRHPFTGDSEFIRISNDKQFQEYNNGRIIELHVTMPAQCPYYIIDFDAVGDWKKTLKITGEIADGLKNLTEVKSVDIRYSGKRGFHILGWLEKPTPIDKAREDLKVWLKETFGDRDDVVVGESPSGKKGALGVSPMKLNGGQVALWSLRVTGLCCVEVPRASLMSFKKEDASLEKTYKKLTGKTFMSKSASERVVNAFLTLGYGEGTRVEEVYRKDRRRMIVQPKTPKRPADPNEPFAKPGERVHVLNKDGDWVMIPWTSELETVRKTC